MQAAVRYHHQTQHEGQRYEHAPRNLPGGTWSLGDLTVTRFGYGAMRDPLQSSALSAVAARLNATPMAVALAWLLQRSPNILLIPGTSSAAHLRQNADGARLSLSGEDLAELDKIGH